MDEPLGGRTNRVKPGAGQVSADDPVSGGEASGSQWVQRVTGIVAAGGVAVVSFFALFDGFLRDMAPPGDDVSPQGSSVQMAQLFALVAVLAIYAAVAGPFDPRSLASRLSSTRLLTRRAVCFGAVAMAIGIAYVFAWSWLVFPYPADSDAPQLHVAGLYRLREKGEQRVIANQNALKEVGGVTDDVWSRESRVLSHLLLRFLYVTLTVAIVACFLCFAESIRRGRAGIPATRQGKSPPT